MHPLAYVGLALLCVVLLYIGLARLLKARSIDPGQLMAVQGERDRLIGELQAERGASKALAEEASRAAGRLGAIEAEARSLEVQLQEFGKLNRELQSRLEAEIAQSKGFATTVQSRDEALSRLESDFNSKNVEISQLREALQRSESENSRLSADLKHSQRANDEIKLFLAETQDKLTAAFSQMAGSAIDQKAEVLQKNVEAATLRSREDIEGLLKPFGDRISDFRRRVDELYGDEAKERRELIGAVSELKTLNQDMAAQTLALTRALKGNSKVRGDWGELMLESVLRGSGLEEGVHYERQVSTVNDEGQRLQPDIVVRLPDDRRVVIDSKVNLVAWQEAMNAEDPSAQHEALRRHAVALRQHVKDLGEKNYPSAVGASTLDITIAFVPIEGALSAALGFDAALQGDAFEKRVAFASPNTLMAILRVVERLWTRDRIQRQAQEISDAGSRLLDSLGRYIEHFDAVGKKLDDATKSFGEARRSLNDSPQAIIPRARKLVELGVKGRRALPPDLLPEESQILGAQLSNDGAPEKVN